MKNNILFSEIQEGGNLSVTVLLICVDILLLFIVLKRFKTDHKLRLIGTSLGLLIALTATYLIVSLKQYTEITGAGIQVKLFPLQTNYNFYPWNEISRSYVRTYSAVSEYGGWGLKGKTHDKAINQSGNVGLQLVFKNGDKLLIGTQKPEEIKEVLRKMNHYLQ